MDPPSTLRKVQSWERAELVGACQAGQERTGLEILEGDSFRGFTGRVPAKYTLVRNPM